MSKVVTLSLERQVTELLELALHARRDAQAMVARARMMRCRAWLQRRMARGLLSPASQALAGAVPAAPAQDGEPLEYWPVLEAAFPPRHTAGSSALSAKPHTSPPTNAGSAAGRPARYDGSDWCPRQLRRPAGSVLH